MPDWINDPRPFAQVLRDWAVLRNGGSAYGSHPAAADALRVPLKTLRGWLDGRPCGQEASFRLLMDLLDKS